MHCTRGISALLVLYLTLLFCGNLALGDIAFLKSNSGVTPPERRDIPEESKGAYGQQVQEECHAELHTGYGGY